MSPDPKGGWGGDINRGSYMKAHVLSNLLNELEISYNVQV